MSTLCSSMRWVMPVSFSGISVENWVPFLSWPSMWRPAIVTFRTDVGGHLLVEFGVGERGTAGTLVGTLEHVQQRHQDQGDDDPERQIAEIVHGRSSLTTWAYGGITHKPRPAVTQIGTFIRSCQSGNR